MRELLRSAAAALLIALLLGAVAAGRAEDKDKKDKKDKDLELDKIPKKVMDALKGKFPKAKIHKWTKEKEKGKDDVVYDVEFTVEGKKYEADIKEDGTLLEFEEEFAVKDLPKAVTEAVEKRYPRSKLGVVMKITKLEGKKETPGGYEIELTTAKDKKVEVTVTAEGKITEDTGEDKKKEKDKKDK
jgi:hypothetical protein